MKLNLPITQVEYDLPDGVTLVSTTDLTGRITHCNQAFVIASGFDYSELLGQPHDIVRHPDVPPEAFKDLWATIGRGRPWTGVVKNRRKNGDHYWVIANVTPVTENGKIKAYMSVRLKPTREQIKSTETLYKKISEQRNKPSPTFRLHAGNVRLIGWRDLFGKLHRMTLAQRVSVGLFSMLGLMISPVLLFSQQPIYLLLLEQIALGTVGATAFLIWFIKAIATPLSVADHLAGEVSSCNLDGDIHYDTTSPLGSLMRRIWLINLNMRAIVADVRAEVTGVTTAAQELLQGSTDLSARTEAQAQGVEETSASIEQISGTIKGTAETTESLSMKSSQASAIATEGVNSIQQVAESMQQIEKSSEKIKDIIDVIEQLSFQTNLLSLNAAVEAAHAGKEGRGFAIVAAEVRSLAQRSSSAAKDIRDLIKESSQQVSHGANTVGTAAQTIQRAVSSVQAVEAGLGEISLATKEESLGVSQIGNAMQVLDDVTRQNASLAEQATKACQSLSSRASTLQRAVKVFSTR